MNEAFRNILVLMWAVTAINTNSYASDKLAIQEENVSEPPTIVFGEAQNKSGGITEDVVEQPAGGPNPLGNPIPSFSNNSNSAENINIPNKPQVEQPIAPINNQNNNYAPNVNNDFQNTLEEANGRIYDTQSWPASDLEQMQNPSNPQTIYSPNVNPN